MPITIHCPHDKSELQLKEENKGPEGLLECPKCGCTFRVCLATFNRECFAKVHPKTEWKKGEPIKGDAGFTADDVKQAFKRKRGRPPKNVEKVEVPEEKVEENAT